MICQRCDRPICPDCMITASVGFQCPNCARANQQKVVTPAARWGQGQSMQRPMVTLALIAINVVAYVAGLSQPGGSFNDGYLLGRFVSGGTSLGVAEGQWWRLITGGFLHASAMHLAFNMFALWSLGEVLERALGPVRFAAAYFASLFAGTFGVMLLSPNSPTVGASGAIFGLFGVLLALQLSRGIPLRQTRLGWILGINLAFTFFVPNISIGGHLGGLVGGAIVGVGLFGLPKTRKDPPTPVGWAVIALVTGASIVGSFAAAAAAPPF